MDIVEAIGRKAQEGSAAIDPQGRPGTPDALAALLRWETAGGEWVVRSRNGKFAVVDLISCDGGSVMGHLASSDPDFIDHVRPEATDDPAR